MDDGTPVGFRVYFGAMEHENSGIKGMLGLYKGLPKPVYVLFAATVINGAGIFVYPFLVLFLTQHLGHTDSWTGIFMSIASLAYLPGSMIGGKLADRIGRKKVLMGGQLLASLMFLVCGFLGNSPLIPLFILLHLLFDGATDPARTALQTDITTQENRQASFSLTYLGHNMGFAIGPLVAGYLFYRSPSWIFFGNAIMGLVSVLFVLWKVPESKPDDASIKASLGTDSTERAHEGGLLRALLSRPKILVLAICATFFSFAYSQSLFAIPLHTTKIFGEAGATIYGSMMSVNAVTVVLANAAIVVLLRKHHPLLNISLAGILFAIGFTCMGFARYAAVFYLLTVVYTLGEIIEATNIHYYIANNTPMSHRARFNAVLPIIMGFGHGLAPMVGGLVSDTLGLDALWWIIGATALAGATSIFILYLSDRSRTSRSKPNEREQDSNS